MMHIAFLALAVFAQTKDVAPCAATLAAKITPCAQPSSDVPADAVATLDDAPIRLADLDETTRKKVEGLDSAVAAARARALREEIDDILITREAARRGLTTGRLIYGEVITKTARPTEADVKREIAEHPAKYKDPAEDSDWAAGVLFDRRLASREKEFIAKLEKRSRIKHTPGLHVEVAEADARIDAMTDEKDAVEKVIHQRLLAAEAARRGVSPEEATRAEVTAKIPSLSDAELKAEWEKWKWMYGEDFEKARSNVADSIKQQRTADLEKAWDARLREGHAVRLAFEIPVRPPLSVADARAPATGPKNAPVTLVEWGDFQCPPCGGMSHVIEDVLRSHGDRVRFVFRQYPLSIHPNAWKAAEAALSANAQGKFFPYAHILFANQNSLDVASLKKYAREAGLDTTRFEHDLDSGRFAGDLASDKRRGTRAGVRGTPMFFINGVPGGDDVYSLEGMRAALDVAAMHAKK
jgi:hypothetical protein